MQNNADDFAFTWKTYMFCESSDHPLEKIEEKPSFQYSCNIHGRYCMCSNCSSLIYCYTLTLIKRGLGKVTSMCFVF